MTIDTSLLADEVLARCKTLRSQPDFPAALSSEHIRLEPVVPRQHAAGLYLAANEGDAEAQIWRYMLGGPYPDQAAFGAYLEGLVAMPNGLALCVIDRGSEQAIGVATYCNNVPEMLRIELGGIWYAPRFQRSYANTETIYLLLRHAFETLGYRRLEWKCDAANQRSRAAALRLGFQFEGVFRQHMIIKNRNRDTAWFALLDSDWPQVKARLETRIAAV